jgi:hypothetical protein
MELKSENDVFFYKGYLEVQEDAIDHFPIRIPICILDFDNLAFISCHKIWRNFVVMWGVELLFLLLLLVLLSLMFTWQGVAMDSLNYHSGLPFPTLYALQSKHTCNSFMAVSPDQPPKL